MVVMVAMVMMMFVVCMVMVVRGVIAMFIMCMVVMTVTQEIGVNFQLWNANDLDHRLKPQKLLNIIELSEKVLGIEDFEIEVEYQSQTIGKYDLDFNGKDFVLLNKKTACLAQDQCGIPSEKPKVRLSDMKKETSCCTPGGSCC